MVVSSPFTAPWLLPLQGRTRLPGWGRRWPAWSKTELAETAKLQERERENSPARGCFYSCSKILRKKKKKPLGRVTGGRAREGRSPQSCWPFGLPHPPMQLSICSPRGWRQPHPSEAGTLGSGQLEMCVAEAGAWQWFMGRGARWSLLWERGCGCLPKHELSLWQRIWPRDRAWTGALAAHPVERGGPVS